MSLRLLMIGLIFGTSAALGLFAYQLSSRTLQTSAAPPEVLQPMQVATIVAARPLPIGTLARAEDFVAKSVTTDKLPENAVLDTADMRANLRGALIRRYIESGAPLMMSDFVRPHERGFLAAVLAPNTRAVSIAVNAVSGVAGLVAPGDYVDIILTQEIQQVPGRVAHLVTSETVLSNIRVLAVDQDIAQGTAANVASSARPVSTVTVQADADEAERIAVATRLGQLSLAVRSFDDPKATPGASVSGTDVSTALARAGGPIGQRVQIIQGDQRGEVTFR